MPALGALVAQALPGPPSLWVALGAAVGLTGALLLLNVRSSAGRRRAALADDPPSPEDLPLVSPVTWAVLALALLAVGYHLIAHALGRTHMAAPLPWVLGVAAGAAALSLLTDWLEARGLRSADDAPRHSPPQEPPA